jgi:hypothetical protein
MSLGGEARLAPPSHRRPIRRQKTEAHHVLKATVLENMLAEQSFLLEAETFVQPPHGLILEQDLAPELVQPDPLEHVSDHVVFDDSTHAPASRRGFRQIIGPGAAAGGRVDVGEVGEAHGRAIHLDDPVAAIRPRQRAF